MNTVDFMIIKPSPGLDNIGISRAETYRRPAPKIGRNEPCPCGSGVKFKKCCLQCVEG